MIQYINIKQQKYILEQNNNILINIQYISSRITAYNKHKKLLTIAKELYHKLLETTMDQYVDRLSESLRDSSTLNEFELNDVSESLKVIEEGKSREKFFSYEAFPLMIKSAFEENHNIHPKIHKQLLQMAVKVSQKSRDHKFFLYQKLAHGLIRAVLLPGQNPEIEFHALQILYNLGAFDRSLIPPYLQGKRIKSRDFLIKYGGMLCLLHCGFSSSIKSMKEICQTIISQHKLNSKELARLLAQIRKLENPNPEVLPEIQSKNFEIKPEIAPEKPLIFPEVLVKSLRIGELKGLLDREHKYVLELEQNQISETEKGAAPIVRKPVARKMNKVVLSMNSAILMGVPEEIKSVEIRKKKTEEEQRRAQLSDQRHDAQILRHNQAIQQKQKRRIESEKKKRTIHQFLDENKSSDSINIRKVQEYPRSSSGKNIQPKCSLKYSTRQEEPVENPTSGTLPERYGKKAVQFPSLSIITERK